MFQAALLQELAWREVSYLLRIAGYDALFPSRKRALRRLTARDLTVFRIPVN